MRRIKNLSVTIPSVVGPYTSINCTVTLQSSSIRMSSLLANGTYARSGSNDDRFTDYFGSTDVIVTSQATNDSGMFETNLGDERFLPFEGAGAISTWNLSLPTELAAFDYSTITDVFLQHPLHRARGRRPTRLAGDQRTHGDARHRRTEQPGPPLLSALRLPD
jgi:hypothetical protein